MRARRKKNPKNSNHKNKYERFNLKRTKFDANQTGFLVLKFVSVKMSLAIEFKI